MKTLVAAGLLALTPAALLAADQTPKPTRGPDMIKRMDANGDGVVTRDEAQAAGAEGMAKRFDQLDLDKDGTLTREEVEKARATRHAQMQERMKQRMEERFKSADKNGDGALSKEEAQQGMARLGEHFDAVDQNKDGQVTPEELHAHHRAMGPRMMHRHHGMAAKPGSEGSAQQ